MVVLILLIVFKFYFAESRVFCQDDNATPWTPIGFSCPLSCHVIKAVLEKLSLDETAKKINTEIRMSKKDIRVHNFGIQGQNQQALNSEPMRMPLPLRQNMHCNGITQLSTAPDTDNDIISTDITTPDEIREYEYMRMGTKKTKDKVTPAKTTRVPLYVNDSRKYEKMLRKNGFVRDLKAIWWTKTQGLRIIFPSTASGVCASFAKKLKHKPSMLDKMAHVKCGRRAADSQEGFMRAFTKLLNKYTPKEYPFTMEMTGMLLEKLVGSGYLRDGPLKILNTHKLVMLISHALARHSSHPSVPLAAGEPEPVRVTLKSRHCVTLRAPGCFCRVGWVESGGQCVAPQDCVSYALSEYLKYVRLL